MMMQALMEKNEQIGYYRSISDYKRALELAEELLELIPRMGLEGSEAHGTTLVNVATAYRAAGDCERALHLYGEAEHIYRQWNVQDARMAGLYNNQSMAYQQLRHYDEAIRCLNMALKIVQNMPEAKVEVATTWTNLSTVYYEMGNYAEGIQMAEQAVALFEEAKEPDAHYAGAVAVLAQGCYLQGDYEAAIGHYTKALGYLLHYFGKNDAYAMTCDNCALVLKTAGFPKEAERFAQEAKQVYEALSQSEPKLSGLELARRYYEAYGKDMIREHFPEYEGRAAVGLVGHGSECLGFDDALSRDHDYGLGFCIWLTSEDYEVIGEAMQAAYEQLPKEFLGYQVRTVSQRGEGRVGVLDMRRFYEGFLDSEEGLAMAVNGAVFCDPLGEFTKIRESLMRGDGFAVWKGKVANAVARMAQAGQYNYRRCLLRGDEVAASLALHEFIKEALHTAYLLNRRYMPYYKWAWRGLADLPRLSELQGEIRQLLQVETERETYIERISSLVLQELRRQQLTYGEEAFLEMHVDKIMKAEEHMNPIITQIVALEWEMFQNVRNEGGRASCQNDRETFEIMRNSQFLTWNLELLESYLRDLEQGKACGRNLVMEKYAYMMETTEPEEYQKIVSGLPVVSEEKDGMIEQIIQIQLVWRESFANDYPHLSGQARSIYTSEDSAYNTSFETYLRGELRTYSMDTLVRYGRHIVELVKEGKNLTEEIMRYTTRFYGYESMEQAEGRMTLTE